MLFQKAFYTGVIKLVTVWLRVNSLPQQSRLLQPVDKKGFKNIVEKGKSAGNQHFVLFPHCFLSFHAQITIFELRLICRLQMLWIWNSLKFCRLVQHNTKKKMLDLSNMKASYCVVKV